MPTKPPHPTPLRILVPRLCLATPWIAGSASLGLRQSLVPMRSQAEPGTENLQKRWARMLNGVAPHLVTLSPSMPFQTDNPFRRDVWLVQTPAVRLLSEDADFFSQVTVKIEPGCRRHKF